MGAVGHAWIVGLFVTGCAIGHRVVTSTADSGDTGADLGVDVASSDGDAPLDAPIMDDGAPTDVGHDTGVDGQAMDTMDVRVDTGPETPVDGLSCATGTTPCAGMCVVTRFDNHNCGTCGTVCTGGTVCTAGVCVCPAGQGLCGTVCTDLQTDANHCGTCDVVCPSGNVCASGSCVGSCPSGQSLCGTSCVNEQSDPSHCGSCAACTTANALATVCTAGACGYTSCTPGYSDCDGNRANGCELATAADVNHCGSCTTLCASGPDSTATCAAGACGLTCAGSHADCNHTASDGCEVDTSSDAAHCGDCGTVCPTAPHATPQCTAGACTLNCAGGYADCDHLASNGCETTLGTTSNCQHCGDSCGGITPLCSTAIGCW